MRVPIKIKLLRWVKIAYPDTVLDEHGKQLSGRTLFGNKKLEVAKDQHADAEELSATILHEILHVSLSSSGLSEILGEELEEAIVTALENYLAPVVMFRHKDHNVKWGEIEMPWDDD